MYAGCSIRAREGERWRRSALSRNRRQAEKHVGANDGGIRGHELTLIVPDDELRLPIPERIDERDLIAHHVERQERRGIRVEGSVPANRAPIPAAVRRDHVVTRVGDRRHHFAPAVGQVRKPVEQQYERPPLRPCLEHVDGEAVDVRHEPRCDARGKRVVAVRRQLLEGRHCRDLFGAAADAIATPPSAEAPARNSRLESPGVAVPFMVPPWALPARR